MAQLVKNLPVSAGDTRYLGLIPGLEDPLEVEQLQPSPVFLPGEFQWTEEPGGLQSMGSQRDGCN